MPSQENENIINDNDNARGIENRQIENGAMTDDSPLNNVEEDIIDIHNLSFVLVDNNLPIGTDEVVLGLQDVQNDTNIVFQFDESIQEEIFGTVNNGTNLEFDMDESLQEENLRNVNDESTLDPNLSATMQKENEKNLNQDLDLPVLETLQQNLDNDIINDTADNIDLDEDEINDRVHDTNGLSKKRKKGVGPWVRHKRQDRTLKRNQGKSYTTAKGKDIKERKLKDLKECRMKCSKNLNEEVRKKIFDEYWGLGSRDRRVQFVSSLIEVKKTKVTRKRIEDSDKKRDVTFNYHFDVCGQRQRVCKSCFTNTIDEKNKFIALAISNKLKTTSGTTRLDNRGRHSPSNKVPQEKIDTIISHIKSFPTYESHYTRKTNDKLYLPSHLSLTKMYSLYCEQIQDPVSRGIYEREFHKLNLRFKPRKTDTCHKCEVFKMKLQACESEEERQPTLKLQKNHHEAADSAYAQKDSDKQLAEKDQTIKCYAFDLQQCLPTPDLQTSVSFYKRLYWTYNLTFHDLATNEATCYLWHESVANRGANEIASCIYKEILSLPDSVKTVILYSDTCGGQNKNSHVASMFTYILQVKPTITDIHHKFLVPGHTHMECDSDHSVIERQKKKSESLVSHPHDWATLIRCANKKFKVVEMEQEDFFNFAALLKGPLVLRKNNTSGEKFLWRPCRWFNYSKDFGEISYKTNLSDKEKFSKFSLKRKMRRARSFSLPKVEKSYSGPLPIAAVKKRDLLCLLDVIPRVYHDFYKNLKTDNVLDEDPDLRDIDPDSQD